MGSSASKEPVVLVPPLFYFPPLQARNRMLESSYNFLFGKLPLKCLFEDHIEKSNHFSTKIFLKPLDDPHVDLVATVSGPLDRISDGHEGNMQFRWQSDVDDPHSFVDLCVANTNPVVQLRSCAYNPKYGFGAFGILPLVSKKRISSEDHGVMGLRYGTEDFSCGLTVKPFPIPDDFDELPKSAWLVQKMGRFTAGVQYEPLYETNEDSKLKDLKNWSCAIGYGLGSGSPLSPSFNFGLELANRSQFIASFYQHIVAQRKVKNPFVDDKIVGITNYLDVGFELKARLEDSNTANKSQDATCQVAASWQANKNFLFKGKAGPLSSSLSLAFKSWWNPSFTLSVSATRDHAVGKSSIGIGVRVENLREASYEKADPNFVMFTPSKEHKADSVLWKDQTVPFDESDLNNGNFEDLPKELRPLGKFL